MVDVVLLDSNIPGQANVGLEPTLKVGSNWMATALILASKGIV